MQYNGFISTLIERSEVLLRPEAHDDLSVTRHLLAMNTGFALVLERIRGWDNSSDKRLSNTVANWEEVRKATKKKTLAVPFTVDGQQFFEAFRTCNDWVFCEYTMRAIRARFRHTTFAAR